MIIYALISKNNQAYTLIVLVSNCIHWKLSSLQLNFCFLINDLPKSQAISQEYTIFPSYILQVKYVLKAKCGKQWRFGQSCCVNQG